MADDEITTEKMWEEIWYFLNSRGNYDRNSVPEDHDPTIIYSTIQRLKKEGSFSCVLTHESDKYDYLLMGYLLRSLNKPDDALTFFQVAYSNGISVAMNSIGLVHLEKGDTDKAMKCFEIAIQEGVRRAYCNIGSILSQRGDKNEAMIEWEKGAELGVGLCMYNLAVNMKDKDILEDPKIKHWYDPEKAKYYMELGAEKGVTNCMYGVAMMKYSKLPKGKKLSELTEEERENIREVTTLLRKASDLGCGRSLSMLVALSYPMKDDDSDELYYKLMARKDAGTRSFLECLVQGMDEDSHEYKDMMAEINSLPSTFQDEIVMEKND